MSSVKVNTKGIIAYGHGGSAVDKQGNLKKGQDKKINNRWFVLKGNILFYYKAVGEFESQKDPTGFICLEDYGVESEAGSAVFKLTSLHGTGSGQKEFVLEAASLAEAYEWVELLRRANFAYMRHYTEALERALRAASHTMLHLRKRLQLWANNIALRHTGHVSAGQSVPELSADAFDAQRIRARGDLSSQRAAKDNAMDDSTATQSSKEVVAEESTDYDAMRRLQLIKVLKNRGIVTTKGADINTLRKQARDTDPAHKSVPVAATEAEPQAKVTSEMAPTASAPAPATGVKARISKLMSADTAPAEDTEHPRQRSMTLAKDDSKTPAVSTANTVPGLNKSNSDSSVSDAGSVSSQATIVISDRERRAKDQIERLKKRKQAKEASEDSFTPATEQVPRKVVEPEAPEMDESSQTQITEVIEASHDDDVAAVVDDIPPTATTTTTEVASTNTPDPTVLPSATVTGSSSPVANAAVIDSVTVNEESAVLNGPVAVDAAALPADDASTRALAEDSARNSMSGTPAADSNSLSELGPRRPSMGSTALRKQRFRNSAMLFDSSSVAGADDAVKLTRGGSTKSGGSGRRFAAPASVSKCEVCGKTVYEMEKLVADGKTYHKACFRCAQCNKTVSAGTYAALDGKIYCKPCFKKMFKLKGNYAEGFGKEQHKMKWIGGGGGGGGGGESIGVQNVDSSNA